MTRADPGFCGEGPPIYREYPEGHWTTKRHSRHNRRSIRLKGYDYTQPGMYFITVCTYDFSEMFGIVRDGVVVLNEWGKIVERCWFEIPKHFRHVQLDEFVIMPNHIHGILMIVDDTRWGNACVAPTGDTTVDATTGACVAPTGNTGHGADVRVGPMPKSVGVMVGSFKSAISKFINRRCGTSGAGIWQRNYYERIVRSDVELRRIREYIVNNPLKWHSDGSKGTPPPTT